MAGAVSPPLRSASLGSAVVLVCSVVLLGGTAVHRAYSADVLALLVVLIGLLVGGLLLGGALRRPPRWAVVLGGLLGVASLAVAPPVQYVISNGWLLVGVLVLAAAGAVPVLLPLVRPELAGRVAGAGLAGAAAGFGLIILGSIPVIDVWVLLQGAGHGLAGGRNPYELSFPDAPLGQVRDCFTYLPATMLLTAPGVWLGGDARWAELVLLVGTGALLCWHLRARGGIRLALALLVVVLPGSGYLLQQAWTETVVLPALVGTAVLADRGRTGWAAVAFGVALASKQHVLLLVPLLLLCRFWVRELAVAAGTAAALILPWLLANPSRFVGCTVTLFLNVAPRADSLSLWLAVPEPARLPVLVAALLAGYLLAWRYCPRTGAGFLVGAAVVLGTFGLVNKQTFVNQWWLVGALVVAGLALAGEPGPRLSGVQPAELAAARGRTIPDVLPGPEDPPLRVLFCGINPGLVSAATGHHFARPGNRFWPVLHGAGFTPRRLRPDEQHLLPALGLGITNIVPRATARADELTVAELVAGGERLRDLVRSQRPAALGVVGITAYRVAFVAPRATVGPQARGGQRDVLVWALPNPSGLNAHWSLPAMVAEFARFALAVATLS